jgi:hypothetical protein
MRKLLLLLLAFVVLVYIRQEGVSGLPPFALQAGEPGQSQLPVQSNPIQTCTGPNCQLPKNPPPQETPTCCCLGYNCTTPCEGPDCCKGCPAPPNPCCCNNLNCTMPCVGENCCKSCPPPTTITPPPPPSCCCNGHNCTSPCTGEGCCKSCPCTARTSACPLCPKTQKTFHDVVKYVRETIDVPYYVYHTVTNFLTLPEVVYYKSLVRSMKLYRRYLFYFTIILKDLYRQKIITYELFLKAQKVVQVKKLTLERQVKQKSVTLKMLVDEIQKILATLRKLGGTNDSKQLLVTSCIMMNQQRICGLHEKVKIHESLMPIANSADNNKTASLFEGISFKRVFIHDKVFTRTVYVKQPGTIKILKRDSQTKTVTFLRYSPYIQSRTTTVNPTLRKQIKLTVLQNMTKDIKEVSKMFEEKKLTTDEEKWKALVNSKEFREKLVKLVREELENSKVQRKTIEKDIIVEQKKGEPAEWEEIMILPTSLQTIPDDHLAVILQGKVEFLQ